MRARQVIDATRMEGSITSTRGGIEIQGQRVPLEEVAVLLLGNKASITGGAMSMLARYDVVVLNCDWRGVPDFVSYAWIDNSRVATRHRKQAELSLPRRKSAWQAIIKSKILGQQRNLEFAGLPGAERLAALRKEVRSGDPANCEAQAARVYWDALFGAEADFRRVPRSQERVNGMLNYGYTVMRGFVIQAICVAGLWPTYGIWHRNRGNTFALADDLIEPFRPAVDHCVRELSADASLDDREVKRLLVGVTSGPMDQSGATVATCIYDLTSSLAQYIEGDKDSLVPPSWRPSANQALRKDG